MSIILAAYVCIGIMLILLQRVMQHCYCFSKNRVRPIIAVNEC